MTVAFSPHGAQLFNWQHLRISAHHYSRASSPDSQHCHPCIPFFSSRFPSYPYEYIQVRCLSSRSENKNKVPRCERRLMIFRVSLSYFSTLLTVAQALYVYTLYSQERRLSRWKVVIYLGLLGEVLKSKAIRRWVCLSCYHMLLDPRKKGSVTVFFVLLGVQTVEPRCRQGHKN